MQLSTRFYGFQLNFSLLPMQLCSMLPSGSRVEILFGDFFSTNATYIAITQSLSQICTKCHSSRIVVEIVQIENSRSAVVSRYQAFIQGGCKPTTFSCRESRYHHTTSLVFVTPSPTPQLSEIYDSQPHSLQFLPRNISKVPSSDHFEALNCLCLLAWSRRRQILIVCRRPRRFPAASWRPHPAPVACHG